MTIAKLKPWLNLAQSNQFAIGAFNFNTLEQAQAIVAAAEVENAPVVLQVSHNALKYIGSGNHRQGLRYAAAIGREAAKMATIPVILHLDHGTYDEVIEAANLGFSSVMFDGGDLSYAENIAKTQKLRQITSELGVTLEAELGEVPKPGGSESEKDGMLTDPSSVSKFIEETGVDALAVSLGSVHGGKQKNTSIDLPRLKKINALANIPLVLHGSSGVKDDEITQGMQFGLAKINVATQLNQAFTKAVRHHLGQDTEVVDPRPYLGAARKQMQAAVQARMRLFGISGQAG